MFLSLPIGESLRSEQIQHTVKIYRFADVELILRLGHVVDQELQYHGAAESPALNLEVGKSHWHIGTLNVIDTDERGILHSLGKAVAIVAVGRNADMVGAVLAEALAADVFIAGLAVIAAEPAAFIAEELHFVLLCGEQVVQLFKDLVQSEIRHHIAELISVQFTFKVAKIGQHFGGRGNEVQLGIGLFQIVQKQIGMDDHAVISL